MGQVMRKKFFKTFLFVIAGIVIGTAFARFKVNDYRHASVVIKKGQEAKPLYINEYDGKQVLALSVKNLGYAKDIEIKMDGSLVQSYYQPVVKMPFWDLYVDGGKFRGAAFGQRLPVYLTIDAGDDHKNLEVIDSSDNTIIQTVHIMKGKGDGGHH